MHLDGVLTVGNRYTPQCVIGGKDLDLVAIDIRPPPRFVDLARNEQPGGGGLRRHRQPVRFVGDDSYRLSRGVVRHGGDGGSSFDERRLIRIDHATGQEGQSLAASHASHFVHDPGVSRCRIALVDDHSRRAEDGPPLSPQGLDIIPGRSQLGVLHDVANIEQIEQWRAQTGGEEKGGVVVLRRVVEGGYELVITCEMKRVVPLDVVEAEIDGAPVDQQRADGRIEAPLHVALPARLVARVPIPSVASVAEWAGGLQLRLEEFASPARVSAADVRDERGHDPESSSAVGNRKATMRISARTSRAIWAPAPGGGPLRGKRRTRPCEWFR